MNAETLPCRERTFPLQLASEYADCFRIYLRRLQHLLERLGREATLTVLVETLIDQQGKQGELIAYCDFRIYLVETSE